jgi:hypothetical protein
MKVHHESTRAKTIFVAGSAAVNLTDGGQGKASALFRLLREYGFVLSDNPKSDAILAIDHNQRCYRKYISSGGSPHRAILLRLEPESVFPGQFTDRIESKYELVITPGMLMSSESFGSVQIGWPYQFHSNPTLPDGNSDSIESLIQEVKTPKGITESSFNLWMERPILLSMVAGNWVSPIVSNNYGIRRKLARKIPKNSLRIYGPMWNDGIRKKLYYRLKVAFFSIRNFTLPNPISVFGGLFSHYDNAEGFVQNKHEVLRKSKFTLVIENSNSYISEKIFDALICGTVPIYIGPNLRKAGLPSQLAFENKSECQEIMNVISDFDESEIQSKLNSAKQFIASEHFKDCWTEANVYKKIALDISKIIFRN